MLLRHLAEVAKQYAVATCRPADTKLYKRIFRLERNECQIAKPNLLPVIRQDRDPLARLHHEDNAAPYRGNTGNFWCKTRCHAKLNDLVVYAGRGSTG